MSNPVKKTLFTLAKEYDDILAETDGEITDEVEAKLNANAVEVRDKLDAVAWLVKENLPKQVEMYQETIKHAQQRIKALSSRREGLLAYAGSYVELMEDGKHKGQYTIYRRSSESVKLDVGDECLPECYRQMRVEYKADKTAIKAALKAGEPVPGARLEKKDSWSVR